MKLEASSQQSCAKLQAKLRVSLLRGCVELQAKLSHYGVEEQSLLWSEVSSKPHAKLFFSQYFGSILTNFWLSAHLSATCLLEVSTG